MTLLRSAWTRWGGFLRRAGEPGWDGREARLALTLLPLVFYFDKLVLGPWAAVRPHDVFDTDFFRYKELGALLLEHGRVSWFPHYLGGMPAYAWHHTPFYMLCVVSAVLPPWFVYGAMVLSLMAGAGWGMFRLLKERLALPPGPALWGAALFAMASQVQPENIPEVILGYLFPLFYVWSMDAWERRGAWRAALPPLAGLGAILLLAYPVLTLPYYPVLHLAFLFLDRRLDGRRPGTAAWVALLWAAFVIGCLPVLYSLFSFAPEAARRFEAEGVGWGSLTDFFRVFGRVFLETSVRGAGLGALLASAALARESRLLRQALVLWGSLSAVAALSGSELSRLWAGTIFQKMDLSHFAWTVPLALAVVVAVGWGELERRPGLRPRYARLVWASLPFAAVLAFAGLVSVRALGLYSAAAAAIAWLASPPVPRDRPVWRTSLAVALAAASFRAYRAFGDEPEKRLFFPAMQDRSFLSGLRSADPGPWRAGAISCVSPEVLANYGWEAVDGRGPIMNRAYKDYFRLIVGPQLRDPERARRFDRYWYNLNLKTAEEASPDLDVPLLELANVRYLLSKESLPQLAARSVRVDTEVSDTGRWARRLQAPAARIWPRLGDALTRAFPERACHVYVLRDALPRGFLADRVVVKPLREEVLAALAGSTIETLRSTAFLAREDFPPADEARWTGRAKTAGSGANAVRLAHYAPDRLEFDVDLAKPAVLVVTNNFHRHWRASVDGRETQVLRADHAFQAVLLPEAGKHRAALEFQDPSLGFAHAGILAGALLLALPLTLPPRGGES